MRSTGASDGANFGRRARPIPAAATHCAVTMNLEGGRKVTYWGSCDDVEAMDRAGPPRTPFSVVAVTDVDGAGRRECSAMGCPNRQGGDGLSPFSRCGRCRISTYVPARMSEARRKHQHESSAHGFVLYRVSGGGGDDCCGGACRVQI